MEKGKALKSFLHATLFVAFACGVALPAWADLIDNGTFFITTKNSFTSKKIAAGDTTIADWTVAGNSVNVVDTEWEAPPGGGYSVDLDAGGPSSIYQTVTTVSGDSYVLTFELAGNPLGDSKSTRVKDLDLSVGGPEIPYMFDVTGHSTTSMGYELETYIFTASSDSTTITFASEDKSGSDRGPVIGDVDLELAPEPGFYGVLAVGLAGLAFVSIRRRKKLQKI